MTKEPLYYLTVSSEVNGVQLIAVTGQRDTVIDAALRVIIDAAPQWQDYRGMPTFRVMVQEIH